MPEAFDRCVKFGGRVRTISGPNKRVGLGKSQFMRVCFDSNGMHRGEVKTKRAAQEVGKRS